MGCRLLVSLLTFISSALVTQVLLTSRGLSEQVGSAEVRPLSVPGFERGHYGITGGATGGDPVDLQTGLFVRTETDFVLEDIPPVVFARTYRNRDDRSRPFGIGTSHSYEWFLVGDSAAFTYVDLILSDGGRIHYRRISPGTDAYAAVFEHVGPTKFSGSRLRWRPGHWHIQLRDGSLYSFLIGSPTPTRGSPVRLIGYRDPNGNTLTLTRDAAGNLTKIETPKNQWINLSYGPNHRISRARDSHGRSITYEYDAEGQLILVRDEIGRVTKYTYDALHNMKTITEPTGRLIRNEYDGGSRVIRQTTLSPDKTVFLFRFAYVLDGDKIIETDVIGPDGKLERVRFNRDGYAINDTLAVGEPDEASIQFRRHPRTNEILDLIVTCTSFGGSRISRRAPVQPGESHDEIVTRLRASCKGGDTPPGKWEGWVPLRRTGELRPAAKATSVLPPPLVAPTFSRDMAENPDLRTRRSGRRRWLRP